MQWLAPYGSRLFLSVTTAQTGPELWVSDTESNATTAMVKEIVAGPVGSYPTGMVAGGDQLLFSADDGISGLELWTSDGTARATYRVADIEPGRAASSPAAMCPAGSQVLFAASTSAVGRELWAVPVSALVEGAPIFSDGFESATTAAWSVLVE